MQNLWNATEADQYEGDLGRRVYSSRLLGRNKNLVLHGGGNTSLKVRQKNIFGMEEAILYVKGSGADLATIQAGGFTPLRMSHLLALTELATLTDTQMANELRCAMTDANAPAPSVESLLHALIPQRYVDHTHADAIITLTNTPNGQERLAELFGERVIIVPYIMPGFKLARYCAEIFPQQLTAQTEGIILLQHGIFTFGESAQEAYERMIALVSAAEDYLAQHTTLVTSTTSEPQAPVSRELAAFRYEASKLAGFPLVMTTHPDLQAFARRENIAKISQQGPLTPDHVIRTKRLPLLGRDVSVYAAAYRDYFEAHSNGHQTMLDPAPRIVLDPEWGMVSLGRTAKEAQIAAEIYRHTVEVILQAEQLGGYQALPATDIFEMEYWELEQAKLHKAVLPFTGEVALVTGAASGIGKACVDSLLARGAAVVGFDLNHAVETLYEHNPAFVGIQGDVSDDIDLTGALATTVQRFGGLDMLVLNAGVFPTSAAISTLSRDTWERVMRINLDANLVLMREAHPLLKVAPQGGRVVIIGSKNVPAPGPGAAAYSASKAALTQLARVAALEWGNDGIRINTVHPNAVFDTGLWSDDILNARAKHYGMTVEQYKTNNVLRVEVTSQHVGELVAELCGEVFSRTTGAQIPIDGGNDRVI